MRARRVSRINLAKRMDIHHRHGPQSNEDRQHARWQQSQQQHNHHQGHKESTQRTTATALRLSSAGHCFKLMLLLEELGSADFGCGLKNLH